MKNKRLRNDIILVLALLLAAAAVWGAVKLTQKSGSFAVVEINGNETARYPLDTDCSKAIETADGHVNLLIIEGGAARIEEADCPDKLCIKQGSIRMAGESIICLPHRLVIRIAGDEGVDAVS